MSTKLILPYVERFAYVFGRYSGSSPEAIQSNIAAAEAVERCLVEKGWGVICPHKNTAGFERLMPEVPWQWWLAQDLSLVRRLDPELDILVGAPGFYGSSGAAVEMELARNIGIRIYTSVDEVPSILSAVETQDISNDDETQLKFDGLGKINKGTYYMPSGKFEVEVHRS